MTSGSRKCIAITLLALSTILPLNAGRAFDVLHAHYRSEIENGHIMRAINLYKPISMRLHQLKHDLVEAERNHDTAEAASITETIQEYRKYLVTAEEAEKIGILKENTIHPEQLREASIFLYENTDFFRPTITIKDEYATDSQVHVWMAKPGSVITFEHEYDESKLDGRIFTGYRRTDGLFRKGEYPTFPMSYDSEVWNAIYEYGFIFHDPYYNFRFFTPVDGRGFVKAPRLNRYSNERYKLAGWKDEKTGEMFATQYEEEIAFSGRSTTLVPIWEYIELERLHLGNNRKTLTNGSEENFYIELRNNTNSDVLLLVDAYTDSVDCIADRIFEFVRIAEGEILELGPYSIEALIGTENKDIEFRIELKSLDSGNQWIYTPSLSIK